jgi:hypothetical protein
VFDVLIAGLMMLEAKMFEKNKLKRDALVTSRKQSTDTSLQARISL